MLSGRVPDKQWEIKADIYVQFYLLVYLIIAGPGLKCAAEEIPKMGRVPFL